MLAVTFALLATATCCWPVRPAISRVRSVAPDGFARHQHPHRWVPRPGPLAVLGLLSAAAWAAFGPAVAVAAAACAATARRSWRRGRETRDKVAAAGEMAVALRAMVAELRAGAHPAAAAETAAADAQGQVAELLNTVAGAARLGGEVDETLRGGATAAPGLRGALAALASAWAVADRHGVPLAELLDAVRQDLEGRVRFFRQVDARMAGARASGAVLAAMPLLGVLMGEAMGAHPVRILLATPVGNVLLVTGVLLACCGVLWIGKLTSGEVLR